MNRFPRAPRQSGPPRGFGVGRLGGLDTIMALARAWVWFAFVV